MTPAQYRAEVELFRQRISAGPLDATLAATIVACHEAKAALRWAGRGDDELDRLLNELSLRLQAEARAASSES